MVFTTITDRSFDTAKIAGGATRDKEPFSTDTGRGVFHSIPVIQLLPTTFVMFQRYTWPSIAGFPVLIGAFGVTVCCCAPKPRTVPLISRVALQLLIVRNSTPVKA